MYAGTQFRSRLEARWAAFFDLLVWKWDYEPIDLSGYIPDFILSFKQPILVEVKPLIGDPSEWDAVDAIAKVCNSGWNGNALLVGAGPALHDESDGLIFGLCAEWFNEAPYDGAESGMHGWNPFTLRHCCNGPVDTIGSYACIKCGDYDGNINPSPARLLTSLWREAGNRVQWRSPR